MFESGRFSLFFSLVSFFRVRLSVRARFRVRVKVTSPIIRELVLSLTRLSFPLVRLGHNPFSTSMVLFSCSSNKTKINNFWSPLVPWTRRASILCRRRWSV